MSIGKSNRRETKTVFLVVATAVFMTNLDLWVVNVAIESMGQSFPGSSLAGLSWVLTAYAVTLAASLVVAGRIGDRSGHRSVFLVGVVVFTLASVACALAPTLGFLVAARVVQAVGAALQLPTSLALLMAGLPAERRIGAARAWAAAGGVAAAAGPVLGGLLVQASWRWVFLINVPIGIATVVAGRRVLPRPAAHHEEPRPDILSGVLLTASVGSMTAALVEGPTRGWTSALIIGLLATSVVSGLAFAWRCTHHANPLIEPGLLRVRRFTIANVALLAFSVAFSIMLLSNALFCQTVWHWSALQTGLAMAPGPALVPVVTVATRRLVQRTGPGPLAVVGSLVFALAMLWRVAFGGPVPHYAVDMLPSMVLGGIGVGLALGTLMAVGATVLPSARAGTGSAVMNTVRQVAGAIGVALLVSILGAATGDAVHAFHVSWVVAAVLAVLAAAISTRVAATPVTGLASAPLPATAAHAET